MVSNCIKSCSHTVVVVSNFLSLSCLPFRNQSSKKEKKSKKKKEEEPKDEGGDAGGEEESKEPKRAQRATSNVFALFNQAQIQEFKEVRNLMLSA